MDLVIDDKKEENYKIKYGAEVYTVNYPSWSQAKKIEKDLAEVKKGQDNDEVVSFITDTLIELGLNDKFFDLAGVKSYHVFKIWSEINAIKK